ETEKLVRKLGSPDFAEREAAEKSLRSKQAATAAASVAKGMKDADPEIVRRCESIWSQLWKNELARPEKDQLAGFEHPLWTRFRATCGDVAVSRTMFAEMVTDIRRFKLLDSVETDPKKAGDAYLADLKYHIERMAKAYVDADREAGGRTGVIW